MGAFARFNNSVDGSRQIDETYKNLALRAKGTFTASDGVVPVAITVAGVNPVVAVRSTGANSPVMLHSATDNGGGSWTYRFLSKAGDVVTYYVFDEPGGAPAKYLVIRNAAGEICFNANEEYLIPVSYQVYGWSNGGPNSHVDLPTGRTYAAVQCSGDRGFSSAFLGTGIWAVAVFGVGAYFDATGVILEGKGMYSTSAATPLGNSPAYGRFLIVDVTGF